VDCVWGKVYGNYKRERQLKKASNMGREGGKECSVKGKMSHLSEGRETNRGGTGGTNRRKRPGREKEDDGRQPKGREQAMPVRDCDINRKES